MNKLNINDVIVLVVLIISLCMLCYVLYESNADADVRLMYVFIPSVITPCISHFIIKDKKKKKENDINEK